MNGGATRLIAALVFVTMCPLSVFAETPNDPEYDEQWYLDMIDAPEAWDTETGDDDVIVAVLDTGVDINHPDLEDNVWVNTGETPDNGIDDDGNGYIDDYYGWDFVDDDNTPTPDISEGADEDAISHGTVISGIIAAVGDNNEGLTGVVWDAQIMAVRMLDKVGSGNSVDARSAIEYAVDNGADVINLSFSGTTNDPALKKAVQNAYNQGVVIVAALGNDGENINNNPVYPACYRNGEQDWVIGVAASNKYDKHSLFSNYGYCADLSAPGEDMYGLFYYDPDNGYSDAYGDDWAGTSVASPVVAGAAALLLSEYPSLEPADIRNILKLSVDPMSLSGVYRNQFGSGRLNVDQALILAASYVSETDGDDDDADDSNPAEVTGYYITSPSFSTVYYITDEGTRFAFMNTNAYFTWSDTFGDVQEVEDGDLSDYSLAGVMLPKAGVVLVKIQSDPSVYMLDEGDDPLVPVLRKITTEDIAIEMYGSDWADYVIDVEPTFFTKFEIGDEVDEAISVDKSIMKTRQELTELAQ